MTKKKLAVALQGGGSHGAFTWGVLDRLLEEEDIELSGFCGTSAGAMNAALLAYGLQMGDRQMARELLAVFWDRVSRAAAFSPLRPSWYDRFFATKFGNMDYSVGYLAAEFLSLYTSPYQFNPSRYNPLRPILESLIDFDVLRNCQVTKLFICATNVRRGRARVFTIPEMSVDVLLASACLPTLFQAVTINGEDYWDGGYMGNPPIFPLIDGTDAQDVLLVQINPINIPSTPTDIQGIRDRINELSFNSSLMLEMRRFAFVDKLLNRGIDMEGKLRRIYFHNINPEDDLWELNASSKVNADRQFLDWLFQTGRRHAHQWLAENHEAIGQRATTDVRGMFL